MGGRRQVIYFSNSFQKDLVSSPASGRDLMTDTWLYPGFEADLANQPYFDLRRA